MFNNPLTFISTQIDLFFKLKSMQRLEKSHPQLVGFLKKRLGMRDFLGLPLTLLLIILTVNFLMLSEIAENLVNSPGMKAVDSSVGLFLYHLRTDAVAQAMYWFTQLGSASGVVVEFILVAGVLLVKKKWHFLAALLVSVLGTGISVYFTKLYFHRERPIDIAYYTAKTFSFPSGHSAEALSLFGMVAVFVLLERKRIAHARLWAGLFIAYIVLIGFSRLYLGVHFVSDVAGAYLLASLWLILAVCVLEYLLLHYKPKSEIKKPRSL